MTKIKHIYDQSQYGTFPPEERSCKLFVACVNRLSTEICHVLTSSNVPVFVQSNYIMRPCKDDFKSMESFSSWQITIRSCFGMLKWQIKQNNAFMNFSCCCILSFCLTKATQQFLASTSIKSFYQKFAIHQLMVPVNAQILKEPSLQHYHARMPWTALIMSGYVSFAIDMYPL